MFGFVVFSIWNIFAMKHRWPALALGVCLAILPQTVEAAARKPARKTASKIIKKQVLQPVVGKTEPVRGGFMVPKAVALRPTTTAESEANAIWNLRAALNVAALQCQFSRYLATVKNYNDFLKQHSEELVQAQAVMLHHFQRYDKGRAPNSFDQYTTRTYNSYTTLDAQYNFCDAAGLVGREVLTIPNNGLAKEAVRRNAEIRSALEPRPLSPALAVTEMSPLSLPQIAVSDR